MKQKVFTLLTLLVLCVTGAWADISTIFSLTSVSVAGNVSVASGAKHSITASEATIVGGTAEVYNGSGSAQNMLVSANKQVSISGSGNSYFHVSDRKSTRLNSSHKHRSRMPSSA